MADARFSSFSVNLPTSQPAGFASSSGYSQVEMRTVRAATGKLDHTRSNLPAVSLITTLTHEQVKELASKGMLGSTEIPESQIW